MRPNPLYYRDMTQKITRQGSGRTKGSYSFVKITLEALNAKFADKTTPIVCGRKWAESCSFQGLVANPANTTMDAIQGQTPETQVGAKVVDLDE